MPIQGQDRNLKFVDLAVKENLSVLLIGETGSGKTSMIQEKAAEHGKKIIRFNLTGETTVDEFVGKYVLRANPKSKKVETVWEDGVLLQAMKRGDWLLVDEINAALPEILMILHPLLDDDKAVLVANHECEIVKAHKDFRFFATMNPDEEYVGTKTLNKAFRSRFQMILNIEYPTNEIEQQIIVDRSSLKADTAYQMVAIAQEVRKLKHAGTIYFTFSTRDLLQWAHLATCIDIHEAFEVAVLNKANGDREEIMKVYKNTMVKFREIEKNNPEFSPEALKSSWDVLNKAKEDFETTKKDVRKVVLLELTETLK